MKKLELEVDFLCGEVVTLKTDEEKQKFIITGHSIRENGSMVSYEITGPHGSGWHYSFELEPYKNKGIKGFFK